jgi:hypothetical protein
MTKGELIDLVLTDDEKRNIDLNIEEDVVNDIQRVYHIDLQKYYAWSYIDNVRPCLLNLAELYIERFLCKDATKNIIDINEELVRHTEEILKHIHGR